MLTGVVGKNLNHIACCSLVALLAACGGGDGGKSSSSSGGSGGSSGSNAGSSGSSSGGSAGSSSGGSAGSSSGGSSGSSSGGSSGSSSGGSSMGGSSGSSMGGSSVGGSSGSSMGGSSGSSAGGSSGSGGSAMGGTAGVGGSSTGGSSTGGSSTGGSSTGGSSTGGSSTGGSSAGGTAGMGTGGSATGGTGGSGMGGSAGTGGSGMGGSAGTGGAGGSGGSSGSCAPLDECQAQCVDLQTNPTFCGNCTTSCDANQVCLNGTCTVGVGELVLSEIHAQAGAYFEIFNGSSSSINLQNYQVQWSADDLFNGAFQLPSYDLGPGEYVVVVEGSGTHGDGFIFLGQSVGWLNHIAVRLLNPSGLGLDFVRTGTSNVPPPTGTGWTGNNTGNPSAHAPQSLVRDVTAADTDSDTDWMLVEESSTGGFCGRADQCGDVCVDLALDHDNCGACGFACSVNQVCIDSECGTGFVNLWISEYRRSGRPGVELHNPTETTINLNNYRVDITGPENFSYTFPNVDLPPGEFVFLYMGTGTDDARTFFGGASAAFGGDVAIALYDSAVNPLDFVRIGGSTTPPPSGANWFGNNVAIPADGENQSVRRDIEKFDTDGMADWHLASPATPGHACYDGMTICNGVCVNTDVNAEHCGGCGNACGAEQTCAMGSCNSVGAVVISEVRNQSNDTFEIYNGGDMQVDLSNWKLEWVGDQVGAFTIPSGVTIDPGAFIRFEESGSCQTADRICMGTTVQWTDDLALSLKNNSDLGVDFLRTGSSVQMPPTGTSWSGNNAPDPATNQSLVRDVFSADSDSMADWTIQASATPSRYCVSSGDDVCGSDCVDLDDDASNCGACGNACPYGNECFQGLCVEIGATRLGEEPGYNGTSLGRLDIFTAGNWRSVDNVSGTSVYTVACRQLGFSTGAYASNSRRRCTDCSEVDLLTCTGPEALLTDCSLSGLGSGSSTSFNYYAVQCTP